MQAGTTEGLVASQSLAGKRLHYAYYQPEDWRARLEIAGFAVDSVDYRVTSSEHCNPGATGWIESLARLRYAQG
jgi:hypothetical protein